MPDYLREDLYLLWKINEGTPFPYQMEMDLKPHNGHVSIKPRNDCRVSPDTFQSVMSVSRTILLAIASV